MRLTEGDQVGDYTASHGATYVVVVCPSSVELGHFIRCHSGLQEHEQEHTQLVVHMQMENIFVPMSCYIWKRVVVALHYIVAFTSVHSIFPSTPRPVLCDRETCEHHWSIVSKQSNRPTIRSKLSKVQFYAVEWKPRVFAPPPHALSRRINSLQQPLQLSMAVTAALWTRIHDELRQSQRGSTKLPSSYCTSGTTTSDTSRPTSWIRLFLECFYVTIAELWHTIRPCIHINI